MLASGISLQNALGVVEKSAAQELSAKIIQVRNNLLEGRGAFDAFEDFPHIEGEIGYLIKVGEETSDLGSVFMEISRYFEDKIRLKSKIISSLSYPSFIMVICFSSFIGISVFLLPNFKNLFASSGVKLPALTQFFIDFGIFLQLYGIYVVLLIVLLGFLFKRALKKEKVKEFTQQALFKIPGVSKIIYCYLHLRIVKVLLTLLGSQVPLVNALSYVKKVCPNTVFKKGFSCIISEVESGASLAEALVKQKIFSPLLKEVVIVSEETGNLESLLSGLGSVFEEELDGSLKKVTMFLEPVATLGVGVFVGLVAISMLYPMTELMNSIK